MNTRIEYLTKYGVTDYTKDGIASGTPTRTAAKQLEEQLTRDGHSAISGITALNESSSFIGRVYGKLVVRSRQFPSVTRDMTIVAEAPLPNGDMRSYWTLEQCIDAQSVHRSEALKIELAESKARADAEAAVIADYHAGRLFRRNHIGQIEYIKPL